MIDAEARRAKKRAEYANHRDRYLAYMKDYQRRKPEINREACRRYRAANPTKRQDTILKYRYKLTYDDYLSLIAKQGGKCVSCGREPRRWYVDHDHRCCPKTPTCGKCTRGLVCNGCNTFDRLSPQWTDRSGRVRGSRERSI